MTKRHSYGWKKDKPDSRDHIYHGEKVKVEIQSSSFWKDIICWFKRLFGMQCDSPTPIPTPPSPSPTPTPTPTPSPSPLSSKVDLRSQCPPVVDQGDLGSCTANALAGALAFLEVKDSLPDNAFSRLYIYYNERVIEGTVSSDSGAEIRDGIKTLSQGNQGACLESTWPYSIGQFATQPPQTTYTEGEAHEIIEYARILSLDDMKACLAAGFPFVFGFTVYESFESPQVASTGIVPMPKSNEQVLGGHAVVCVGYDDSTQMFIVRNSWGTSWGLQGYFMIPYAYLTDSNLATDFWTIRRGEEMLHEPQKA